MQGGSVSGFYLVSSLSEIWVKIQPGLWLAVEKVWVPQLLLHTEPPSWLGSVGLRYGMLQAWEKGLPPHTHLSEIQARLALCEPFSSGADLPSP